MNKILLIGNHFYDEYTCLLNGKIKNSFKLGGIDNCEPAFDKTKCEVFKYYTSGAKCTFLINQYGEDCVVDYNWKHPGLTTNFLESQKQLLNEEYDWCHICYANTIRPNDDLWILDRIKSKGFSCDLVTKTPEHSQGCFKDESYYLPEFLQRMKWISLSEKTNWTLYSWILNNTDIKAKLFIHGSDFHKITDTSGKIILNESFHKNNDFKFTVGAGDYCFSKFLNGVLNYEYSEKLSQLYAKEETNKWLKEINLSLS